MEGDVRASVSEVLAVTTRFIRTHLSDVLHSLNPPVHEFVSEAALHRYYSEKRVALGERPAAIADAKKLLDHHFERLSAVQATKNTSRLTLAAIRWESAASFQFVDVNGGEIEGISAAGKAMTELLFFFARLQEEQPQETLSISPTMLGKFREEGGKNPILEKSLRTSIRRINKEFQQKTGHSHDLFSWQGKSIFLCCPIKLRKETRTWTTDPAILASMNAVDGDGQRVSLPKGRKHRKKSDE